MADNNDVLLMLGRIEGKLDTAITAAEQHRQDDIRRFSEVYTTINEHAEDINKAKGAKGAILLMASGAAALVSAGLGWAAKAMGWH